MAKLNWNLWDDLEHFDLGGTQAQSGVYQGKQALYIKGNGSAILLRDDIAFDSYRIEAEVAIPEQVGFVGLVFGAQDSHNYELVYLAPVEIQYDPIMNGSMTWQIYNGSLYQKELPNTTGKWMKFAVEVQPNGAAVYLGDDPTLQLIIPNLQHSGKIGKIGVWSFLPSYIRNLSVEGIEPISISKRETDLQSLSSETFITDWMVSEPYLLNESPITVDNWIKASVEENGTLNLNRIYRAEQGISVQVQSMISVPEEKESVLTFGYSDSLRLWINEEEIYQGSWRWNPPLNDGRIRSNYASVPVRWRTGQNTIRAEITNQESFGWGISMRTGLS